MKEEIEVDMVMVFKSVSIHRGGSHVQENTLKEREFWRCYRRILWKPGGDKTSIQLERQS